MQRGLQDRRIALFAAGDRGAVARALEARGARVAELNGGLPTRDEDWHGARYAGLVIVDAGANETAKDPRIVQLTREFLVGDKPVCVFGGGIQVLHEAGGTEEDALVAQADGNVEEFATRLSKALATQLEESQIDDMSDQSFPASDPPSTTPASIGPRAKDARP
jgi:putative intracellular protease/amidase